MDNRFRWIGAALILAWVSPALADGAAPSLPSASTVSGPLRHGSDGGIEAFDPTKEHGTGPRLCGPRALCVGPGQAFGTLGAAAAAARDGDLIEVVAGTYHESVKIERRAVTVRGIEGRPHIDCAGLRPVADKACLLLTGNGITLENLEISGAVVPSDKGANAACIRNEHGASFTIRDVICHGSQDGILSAGGTIVIDDSEFYDNGWTGLTHNVYFDGDCAVTVTGSVFRDARVGHEFKSRCPVTKIFTSVFRSTKGSRDLDIPDGGDTLVDHSTLVKTADAESQEIVGFTAESCKHRGDMVLRDVLIINSRPHADIRNFDKCEGNPIILEGMRVEGMPIERFGNVVTR